MPAGQAVWAELLHFLAGGGGFTLEIGTDEGSSLLRGDGARLMVDARLLSRAVSHGILSRKGKLFSLRPEAAAHLRRLLAAPHEAFSAQHGARETADLMIDGALTRVTVNRAESPLGGLTRLKEKGGGAFLSPEACEAGARLHADFTRGGLQPRLTMRYEPHLGGSAKGTAPGMAELSDSALSARLRVEAALDAIGPELSGVALDVCCFEKGLETVERERQWPARSAKLLLRAALLALARHYQPPARRSRARHVWKEAADGD
ncbi:hypothetical protein BJF93_19685 [Xaviernesmea oryzae]|uniref:DUF6456 domain-containing protein n=1 Tax=Xaviernesmea oryzae TaxID=464029 RepID=A0A1Q9B1M6_9HYPH|nr:DUF6456 domain-containing protein [Xaviernesmea oryzae]OLP61902.1 hypothetical protein BJF93_19685 [Xaviernesmea oryzae]